MYFDNSDGYSPEGWRHLFFCRRDPSQTNLPLFCLDASRVHRELL
jgi:hypothetical protein